MDNTGEGRKKGKGCSSGVTAPPTREPSSRASSTVKEKSWTLLISTATRGSCEEGKSTEGEWSTSSLSLTRASFKGVSAADRDDSPSTAPTGQSISYMREISATERLTARAKPPGNPKQCVAFGRMDVYSQSSDDVLMWCAWWVFVADNINDEPGELEGDKVILASSGQPFLLVS